MLTQSHLMPVPCSLTALITTNEQQLEGLASDRTILEELLTALEEADKVGWFSWLVGKAVGAGS